VTLRYGLNLMTAFALATGTEVRSAPVACPGCKKSLEVHTGIDGETPIPGAYTICIICGTISQYLPDMTLRFVSRHEIKRMPRAKRKELLALEAFVRLKNRIKYNRN
jgi:hypothetical protein